MTTRTAPVSSQARPQGERLQLKVGGMACSFCTETIRKAYRRTPGVFEAHVSLAHEEVLIRYDPAQVSPTQLRKVLRRVGYTVRDPDKVKAFEEQQTELHGARRKLIVAGALSLLALAFMVGMWTGTMRPEICRPTTFTIALVMIFGPGWYILKKAYYSLRRGILNQHVLLELGALAALVGGMLGYAGVIFEISALDFPVGEFFGVATFLVAYHILSEYVSLLVRVRASQSVQKLLSLQPDTAWVKREGAFVEQPVQEIRVGDQVQVKPGERIPVDGRIIEGRSGVDESVVTGESIPVHKGEGDEVVGGAINQSGRLLIEVTKVGEESFLQQVARHIEEARVMKPGLLQLVDVILSYYVPAVLAFAALGFLVWSLGAWVVTGQADIPRGVFAALAVLVLGYPCALGMATPLAMIRGGGMAAERGILMRSGEAFQVLKDIRRVVLDKTGTLTKGRPEVTEVISARGVDEDDLLRLAASVEDASEHPLGRALVEHAKAQDIRLAAVSDFEALTGKGVRGEVEGRTIVVGKPAFFADDMGTDLNALAKHITRLQKEAKTVALVAQQRGEETTTLGLVAIADPLKTDAREVVTRLKALNLQPVMITGDHTRTAQAVAAQLGIEQVLADVLPDAKAAEVRALQRDGTRVTFVGDGINDAPALMQSDVGIAMGAGTDIAIEAADVILTGERLSAILDSLEIGRRSYRKTVQNLWLAFAFNGIGVPAATTGLVHPVWAMVAMVASVSAVLLNSFGGRLLSMPERRAAERQEPPSTAEALTLASPAIHCGGCVHRITEALEHLDGVEAVKGSARRQEITVNYRPEQVSPAQLKTAMEEAGYPVE